MSRGPCRTPRPHTARAAIGLLTPPPPRNEKPPHAGRLVTRADGACHRPSNGSGDRGSRSLPREWRISVRRNGWGGALARIQPRPIRGGSLPPGENRNSRRAIPHGEPAFQLVKAYGPVAESRECGGANRASDTPLNAQAARRSVTPRTMKTKARPFAPRRSDVGAGGLRTAELAHSLRTRNCTPSPACRGVRHESLARNGGLRGSPVRRTPDGSQGSALRPEG